MDVRIGIPQRITGDAPIKKLWVILIIFFFTIALATPLLHIANAQTTYQYVIQGPFFMNGNIAIGNTVLCNLLWANFTTTTLTVEPTGVGAGYSSTTLISSVPLYQMTWNASSALNYTALIDFRVLTSTQFINVYIPNPNIPFYLYTFPVTDFAGMTNAYLEMSINNGSNLLGPAQQVSLSSSGVPTFVMTQYYTYTLSFICDQGTYSQQFTAESTFTTTLSVLAGSFPSTSTNQSVATAMRSNATTLDITYIDPDTATTSLTVTVTHMDGLDTITDYSDTQTVNSYSTTITVDNATDYYVQVLATRYGTVNEWDIACPVLTQTNPFYGLLDFLGTWPAGLDPSQIIAAAIIMCALGLGSFRSAGVSCVFAWIIAGIFTAIGWFNIGVPMLVFSGVLSIIVVLAEGKETARDV